MTWLMCICQLTCCAVEFMINSFVTPRVDTCCLIPEILLALLIGFSSCTKVISKQVFREFLPLPGSLEHYTRLLN